MVEFTFNEAKALLSSNKENASSNLRQFVLALLKIG